MAKELLIERALAASEALRDEEAAECERRNAKSYAEALEALLTYSESLLQTRIGLEDIVMMDIGDMTLPCVEVDTDVWLTATELNRRHEVLFIHFGLPTMTPKDAQGRYEYVGDRPWRPIYSLADLGRLLEFKYGA